MPIDFYFFSCLLAQQFVAKQFYEIGSDSDKVSMAENILNLECEVIHCEQARWLLRNFCSAAQDHNLETANNFDITQCSLAQEVIIEGGAPSSASGVVREIFEAEPVATRKVVWFLEPLRNPSVTHYTGTMEHPAGRGQLGHTLSAFVHYAFQ
ncbi:hypothetical protein K438DRAFT_1631763 [Mycena galopus ATCC 62051]|nr:hypothetical protein K438DRAFT_1631763 [Mycena galopus ATCC 62051]